MTLCGVGDPGQHWCRFWLLARQPNGVIFIVKIHITGKLTRNSSALGFCQLINCPSVRPAGSLSWPTLISIQRLTLIICYCMGKVGLSGIILYMHPANERLHYIVMSSLIGWEHIQNDPCLILHGRDFIHFFPQHLINVRSLFVEPDTAVFFAGVICQYDAFTLC